MVQKKDSRSSSKSELLGSSNCINLKGEKIADESDCIVVRTESALLEIPREFIVEERSIEGASIGKSFEFLISDNAKIVQSIFIDYSKGERPVISNVFKRRKEGEQLRKVNLADADCSYDCSRCTDCDCWGDCSLCINVCDCGYEDCYNAMLPLDHQSFRGGRFRRRR